MLSEKNLQHRAVSLSYIPTGFPCCNKYELIMWLKASQPGEDVAIFKKTTNHCRLDCSSVICSEKVAGSSIRLGGKRCSTSGCSWLSGEGAFLHPVLWSMLLLPQKLCNEYSRWAGMDLPIPHLPLSSASLFTCPKRRSMDCSHPLYHSQSHHLRREE